MVFSAGFFFDGVLARIFDMGLGARLGKSASGQVTTFGRMERDERRAIIRFHCSWALILWFEFRYSYIVVWFPCATVRVTNLGGSLPTQTRG